MPRVSKKIFKRIVIVSVVIAALTISQPFLLLIPIYRLTYSRYLPILSSDVYLILGLVIAMFPPGIAHLLNVMWRRAVDKNIPRLIRHVAEAGRIGVSIPEALKIASRYDLGPITPLLRRTMARVSWGYPFEKALIDLADELETQTARRVIYAILEASRAGGDIEETLLTLERHITGIHLTIAERRAMMRPYISYGYIAFFVFLAIEVILLRSFFEPIIAIQHKMMQTVQMPILKITADIATIRRFFYHISLIEAIISGLVSGKMGEGSLFAGLKHVAILLIATILTFYLFIFV